ncbi:MAG: TlpA family protein disulfide reductase [Pyrinomonadaceae bacterium MAG19_C2-C3]|nr:TlpA family protein disulfide reductase [Pyrinomonadaceae bacterium MAG19_C2-C3]
MNITFFASLIIASTITVCAQNPASISTPSAANVSVSVLKLKGVNDKKFAVENLRGRVVVASFGATWCVPCVVELQALEELKQEYKGKPIDFVWVSIDDPEQISDTLLRHYIKERRLTMPVLRDETRAAFANFATRTRLPMVVVFDADGKFTAPVLTGMSEPEPYKSRLRQRLDTLLLASENNSKPSREASTRR